jgi:uncharacterized protein (DUF433 family)
MRRIAGWYKPGLGPEEIAKKYGYLSVAQVYAALAYYNTNREETDADLAAEDEEAERLEQEHYLARKPS